MLTGDKFETAETIGFSCKLIGPDFHLYKLRTPADIEKLESRSFDLELKNLQEAKIKFGIMVEGCVLPLIQNNLSIKLRFL